jgi:hypothetical protein
MAMMALKTTKQAGIGPELLAKQPDDHCKLQEPVREQIESVEMLRFKREAVRELKDGRRQPSPAGPEAFRRS